MGICSSCEATTVGPGTTAKLILATGELREFDRPVKVSSVVDKNSDWFVCDADEMEFEWFLTAVGSSEELVPGQIYFVLPRSMLKRPLRAEDLATLAVKAIAALVRGRATPLEFEVRGKEVKATVTTTSSERRRRARTRSGSGSNFVMDLSAIPE